jgi:hydroxymethylbilane synthase
MADLVLGTRGSPLALAQAHELAGRLAAALGRPREAFALDIIRTTGDAITDRALSEAGGKGLFTREIDAAQLAGTVDLSVHSAKDLPTTLPEGLELVGFLPREDTRDALILREGTRLSDLPRGARVGSASLRRQAILRRTRPDLVIELLRGNVGTRIDKVREGVFDATLLALAGLKRLGLAHHAGAILEVDEMLPAVGQGAIALVARTGDARSRAAVEAVSCRETGIRVTAERAMLGELDGSCRTPIAGHATVAGDRVTLTGLVVSPDGREAVEDRISGPAGEAAALGRELGRALRARAPAGIYDEAGRVIA